jgi:hypothetical protein
MHYPVLAIYVVRDIATGGCFALPSRTVSLNNGSARSGFNPLLEIDHG